MKLMGLFLFSVKRKCIFSYFIGKRINLMKNNQTVKGIVFSLLCFCIIIFCTVPIEAVSDINLSTGQTVYVPVYSHIFIGDRALPFNLAVTLSIRNTDTARSITALAADYYDSNGKLLKKYINKPVKLAPLAYQNFFIKEKDTSSESGANFIVKWKSNVYVNTPIIETLMIGACSGRGISFISPGQEIKEQSKYLK
jgi:hypothetical protein